MEHQQLTVSEAWLIAGALRLASKEYARFALTALGHHGAAFRKQAVEALALAETFELAEAVIIR